MQIYVPHIQQQERRRLCSTFTSRYYLRCRTWSYTYVSISTEHVQNIKMTFGSDHILRETCEQTGDPPITSRSSSTSQTTCLCYDAMRGRNIFPLQMNSAINRLEDREVKRKSRLLISPPLVDLPTLVNDDHNLPVMATVGNDATGYRAYHHRPVIPQERGRRSYRRSVEAHRGLIEAYFSQALKLWCKMSLRHANRRRQRRPQGSSAKLVEVRFMSRDEAGDLGANGETEV